MAFRFSLFNVCIKQVSNTGFWQPRLLSCFLFLIKLSVEISRNHKSDVIEALKCVRPECFVFVFGLLNVCFRGSIRGSKYFVVC